MLLLVVAIALGTACESADTEPPDPCESNPCLNDSTCSVADDGQATCACAGGWSGDLCDVDIDECASDPAPCDANATCTNSDGAYACACNDGWDGDGTTCTDIDECTASSLGFDGVDDFVEVPYAAELEMVNALTLSAWVYPETPLDNESTILMKGQYGYGFQLTWTGDGNCSVNQAQNLVYWDQSSCSSAINSTITYEFDEWQHAAVTVQDVGTQLEIYFYLDGVQDGPHYSQESSIDNGGADSSLRFGDQGGQGTNPFHGNMAHLAIWDTVLSSAAIGDLAAAAAPLEGPAQIADLVAYWPLLEGSGATVYDQSGNAHHGALDGTSWTGPSPNPCPGGGQCTNTDGSYTCP